MRNDNVTDRRSMLKTAGAAVGMGVLAAGASGCNKDKAKDPTETAAKDLKSIQLANDTYYVDGKFSEDKAKDAFIALMKYHGYPVFPGMKGESGLWVSDYGTGQYAKLGLGARMWMNNAKDRYMLMDLFLMPGQMLPEHWHLEGTEGDDKGNPAKLEGWLIRYGKSYVVGIGEPNLPPEVKIPACHDGGKTTTAHCTVATPGVFVALAEVKSKHWQWAGPEGAIITEVANVHSNSAVRHQDKACNDFFLSPPKT